MNKQEMLRDYKKSEDKMCLAQVLDKIESSAGLAAGAAGTSSTTGSGAS